MNRTIIGNVVFQNGNELIIDGKKIDVPKEVGRFGSNTAIINGKIFMNGWELKKDGTWKRTLKAFWHLWF